MRLRRVLCQLLAFLTVLSCGGTTIGDLVNLPFLVGGVDRDASQPFVFTNPQGWTVTLQTALIYLGPFYFNIDPPQTSTYHSGVYILQATQQVLVDVLDPTLHIVDAGADGETGTAGYAEIELYPADATQIPPTELDAGPVVEGIAPFWDDGQQAFVQGVATKLEASHDGSLVNWRVNFSGFIQIDQTFANAADPLVWQERALCQACYFADAGVNLPDAGPCSLDIANVPESLVLRVDPTHWFDQADFNDLIPNILLDPPVVDAGPRDAGPEFLDGGLELADGGIRAEVDAGPPPVDAGPPHKTYNASLWEDTSTFNQALVQGVQGQNYVFNFSLVPLASP